MCGAAVHGLIQTIPSIPSGEPPNVDSRLRGNDGCAKVSGSGHPVVWRGTLLGGIRTLRQPPRRGIHTLPSTPLGRPPQPTVMPAEGDVCVTPPVGDSVAEMASIPSGEPPNVDSRLRGNDGCAKVSGSGHPVVWRGTLLGRHPQPPSTSLARHPYPAVNPFGEAATAYRHARGGGHPGVWRGTLLGGIRTLRQPPWRGHQYPAVNPFGEAPHPPSTTSLARHPYPAVNAFVEAATAYRHAHGRRPLRNSPCGRQRGGDG